MRLRIATNSTRVLAPSGVFSCVYDALSKPEMQHDTPFRMARLVREQNRETTPWSHHTTRTTDNRLQEDLSKAFNELHKDDQESMPLKASSSLSAPSS